MHRAKWRSFVVIFLMGVISMGLILPLSVLAQDNKRPTSSSPKTPAPSDWSGPILFFQKTVSKADGNRCPMNPSCSQYALEAFEKHGFFTAWMLTSDRLLRCGHNEIRIAPRVRKNGRLKAHDPLSANTFWWDKP